jgi:hypothetical protein
MNAHYKKRSQKSLNKHRNILHNGQRARRSLILDRRSSCQPDNLEAKRNVSFFNKTHRLITGFFRVLSSIVILLLSISKKDSSAFVNEQYIFERNVNLRWQCVLVAGMSLRAFFNFHFDVKIQ